MTSTQTSPNKLSSQQLLEFAFLIGNLKKTRRSGWVRKKIENPESIADHMYRMGLLAWIFGDQFARHQNDTDTDTDTGTDTDSGNRNTAIDTSKLIKMALIHDVIESICGDIIPIEKISGVSKQEKQRLETNAMQKIKEEYLNNTSIGHEMSQLWLEYENGQTLEAQIVKDLDKLDMVIQAQEYESTQPNLDLEEFFQSTKGIFKSSIAQGIDCELRKQRKLQRKHKLTPNPSINCIGNSNSNTNAVDIIDNLLNIL